MQPTDIRNPDVFHKVVDCQWACPAHTPVPEYIRLIAQGRYADAYMVNWRSNVFPGILGRTCDRPCEPACRRGRVEGNNGPPSMRDKPEPVAICRLKRVAADFKGDVSTHMPKPATQRNGRRIACVGAGPASLTVARDLAPLGYAVTVFEADPKAGGFMRTQVPRFRLPESVIDEETGAVRVTDETPSDASMRVLHKTIAGVREDYDALRNNTAVAKLTVLTNHLTKEYPNGAPRALVEPLVLMVAPLAPHLAEELWRRLGHDTPLAHGPFPAADERYLVDDTVELPVQVNGKVRGKITVAAHADKAALEAAALTDEKVLAFLDGATPKKVIVVPGRLVNLVV